MANKFYGDTYDAHYEKEIKDFTPKDWIISGIYFLIIIAAVVLGFCNQWGPMVIMAGAAVCMIHIFMLTVMKVNNKIVKGFFILGLFVIIGGMITCTGHYEYLVIYGVALYVIISFGVGIFCLILARKKRNNDFDSDSSEEVVSKSEGASMEIFMGIFWIAMGVIVITVLGICYCFGVLSLQN